LTASGCGGSDERQVTVHRGEAVEDPTGDAPDSGDISAVKVSGDTAGFLTFEVSLVGQPGPETAVVVLLDTDSNTATGGGRPRIGADYAIAASELSEDSQSVDLLHWTGKKLDYANSNYSANSRLDGGVLTFGARSESFTGDTFKFAVATLDENGGLDVAPDRGHTWTYRGPKHAKPARLAIVAFSVSPRRPRAGHRVAASVRLKGSPGMDVSNDIDDFTCNSTAEPVTNDYSNDADDPSSATVRCVWRIPPGTSGTMFRGALNIVFRGKTLSKIFSARVSP
jgi:hypothetical protein